MEKRHLHYGVDTCTEPAFTRQFRRVDDIEACLTLLQDGLHFLRQPRPGLFGTIGSIEQENAAGFQALRHLVSIDKLQLVAADKVGATHQIGRVDGLFADAQVGYRQASGLFRVINEIALGIHGRAVADDFDVVLGRGNGAVTAKTVEQRLQRRALRQGFFTEWQGKTGHIVENADGKAWTRAIQSQLVKHG
ncbi:hypothetical protein D3C80_863960 [compost metagenome]